MNEAEHKQTGKIPERFRSCFWDSDFEHLDLRENAYFIIGRMYVKGGVPGIGWVRDTYSDETIKEAAKCVRDLNPIVANYLRASYNLEKEDMAYYRIKKIGGRELWPY